MGIGNDFSLLPKFFDNCDYCQQQKMIMAININTKQKICEDCFKQKLVAQQQPKLTRKKKYAKTNKSN